MDYWHLQNFDKACWVAEALNQPSLDSFHNKMYDLISRCKRFYHVSLSVRFYFYATFTIVHGRPYAIKHPAEAVKLGQRSSKRSKKKKKLGQTTPEKTSSCHVWCEFFLPMPKIIRENGTIKLLFSIKQSVQNRKPCRQAQAVHLLPETTSKSF